MSVKNASSRKKGQRKLSATANPNVVGGSLVVIVVGIFVLWAWLDHKKNPHHSTNYSSRHKPSGYHAPVYREPEEERDPYEEEYQRELARQAAIRDVRKAERIKKQNQAYWEEFYNNTLITNLDPPRFDDPFPPKKRKKQRSIWDY